MTQRLQSLEATREDNLFSTALSVETLETAPDFWQRQQQAFTYVNQQINRLGRRTRVWGSLALLAILADAALVVGGLTAFQAFRQYQANRTLSDLSIQASKPPYQDALDQLSQTLSQTQDPQSQAIIIEAMQALVASAPPQQLPSNTITFYGGSQGTLTSPTATNMLDMQIQAIQTLGNAQVVAAVPALITKLADSEAMIRAAAAEALGKSLDQSAMEPLHKLLLTESNDFVRQQAFRALAQISTGRLNP